MEFIYRRTIVDFDSINGGIYVVHIRKPYQISNFVFQLIEWKTKMLRENVEMIRKLIGSKIALQLSWTGVEIEIIVRRI